MRKIIYLVLLCFTLLLVSPTAVKAENETLQETIDRITETYLNDVGKDDIADLSYEETKELMKLVDAVKEKDPVIQREKARRSSTYAMNGDDVGNILVTGDEQTSSFAHGHAGICTPTRYETIEALNFDDGIQRIRDRMKTYWEKHNSSVLGVVGATTDDYLNAYGYASGKVGESYDLTPGTSGMYCSELVYYAWKSAGKPLYTHIGGFILPAAIYNSANTFVIRSYGTGY